MCILGEPATLSGLKRPERILLWGVRAWVIGFMRSIPIEAPMEQVFSEAGAADAPPVLDALMSIVALAANRSLAIDCVCHKSVSEDEKQLLDAIALLQANRTLEAMMVLRTILPGPAASDAGVMGQRLAEILSEAGLTLRPPAEPVSRFCLTPTNNNEIVRRSAITVH